MYDIYVTFYVHVTVSYIEYLINVNYQKRRRFVLVAFMYFANHLIVLNLSPLPNTEYIP